jgi:hypothetical protein
MTARIADSFLYQGELCADLSRSVGTTRSSSDTQIGGLPIWIRRVGLRGLSPGHPIKGLKEENVQLKPGDKAPAFDLPDQDEKKVSLSDFRGRKILLYFYPKAGTSG